MITPTIYAGNLIYGVVNPKMLLIEGGYIDLLGDTPAYRFFVTDHQGNIRAVTDGTGLVLRTNHYDPYGEEVLPVLASGGTLPTSTAGTGAASRYMYGAKEWDSDLSLYDFSARWYNPAGAVYFTTMDPLCEKYYSVSPYAYCAGNPVNLVDPNGWAIYILYGKNNENSFFYDGTQDESSIPDDTYVRAVIEAYKYNKENWINAREEGDCPSTVLVETDWHDLLVTVYRDKRVDSRYFSDNGEVDRFIIWNPLEGLKTDMGVILSPATIFCHEADHACHDKFHPDEHRYLKNPQNASHKGFVNDEEYRVIPGSEQAMAHANGEIAEGGITRKSYNKKSKGGTVYTKGVTSHEERNK